MPDIDKIVSREDREALRRDILNPSSGKFYRRIGYDAEKAKTDHWFAPAIRALVKWAIGGRK